jgi:hypothetical protein
MIGGRDFVLPGPAGQEEFSLLRDSLLAWWPDAFFEDANSEFVASLAEARERLPEFFVYRNRDAYESWTAHGANAQNASDMIHVILRDQDITLVADYGDEPRTSKICEEIDEAIRSFRMFRMTHFQEAA